MKLTVALSIFLISGLVVAQKPTASAASNPVNVYSQPWQQGEAKSCMTFSGQISFMECDGLKVDWKGSFRNLLGDNAAAGLPEGDAYGKAIATALARSKEFKVQFSEDPWPEPHAGHRMMQWRCTKGSSILCELIRRE